MFSKRSFCALCLTLSLAYWQIMKGNWLMAIIYYLLMSKLWLTFPTLLHKSRAKFE